MKIILMGAVLLLVSGISLANEIPRYDVEAHCEEVAGFGGDFSNTLFNSCIDMEQSAYNGLKPRWSNLPASIQGHCHEVASFGGAGSYALLESCVQMEVSAGSNRSQFSFD